MFNFNLICASSFVLTGDYVKSNCGDAGPFPAFRKLDCGRELPKSSWDFYSLYARSCLQGDDGIPPAPGPSTPTDPGTTPTPPPTPTIDPAVNPSDNVKPYAPDDDDDGKPKPYVPSDDDATKKDYPSSGGSGSGKTGSSHFWRNIFIIGLLGCGAYFYYKRNNDSFAFVRYRSAPRNFGSESEMMVGGSGGPSLTLSGSGNFEPPSLPPPPSALGGLSGYP
jgi:hypothetical protein